MKKKITRRALRNNQKRLNSLISIATLWQDAGGAPISLQDFDFILHHGGELIGKNTLYVDNCYIHRAVIRTGKNNYKFKSLTEEERDFPEYVSI